MIDGMRRLLALLAGLVACVVLPLSIASLWTANVVNDRDEYVDTVGPLAEDERVQEAVADRLADLAVDRLAVPVPRPAIEEAAGQVVRTDLFSRAWRDANRAAHPQLIAVLEDGNGSRDDGEVTIDLAAMARATLERLGSPVSVDPGSDLRFTIARSEDLREARVAYAVLDPAGFWLPVVFVALVALVALVAPNRRGALTWLAIGSAISLGLFWMLLGISRAVFADSLPGADRELGAAVFDVVTDGLVTHVVTGIAVAAVVAVGLALSGLAGGRRRAG